jgi:hypothetical protein
VIELEKDKQLSEASLTLTLRIATIPAAKPK